MQTVSSFVDIKGELQKRGGEAAGDAMLEPLIRELWIRAGEGGPVADVHFDSIDDVAFAFVERLQPASSAVEQVLRATPAGSSRSVPSPITRPPTWRAPSRAGAAGGAARGCRSSRTS